MLIHPFGFDEALRHQGRALPDDATVLTGRERTRLERALLDWLGTGGFPEAQGLDAPSRHQLLGDYVDVAMLCDVVERHDVRNVTSLRSRRGCEVAYVRTPEGYEVDFLARDATGETELIQVCADLSDPATATRECRALAAAGKLFPRARRRLLTLTQDGLSADPPAGVEMHGACAWMLESVR